MKTLYNIEGFMISIKNILEIIKDKIVLNFN